MWSQVESRLGISNEAWRRKARDMSSVNESDTDVSYDLSDGSISLPAVCNRDAEGGERKRRSARTVSQGCTRSARALGEETRRMRVRKWTQRLRLQRIWRSSAHGERKYFGTCKGVTGDLSEGGSEERRPVALAVSVYTDKPEAGPGEIHINTASETRPGAPSPPYAIAGPGLAS